MSPYFSGKNPYPGLIILLLAVFIPFLIWAALRADSHGSRITDTAYYSKGLKYTHTQDEKQAAASRGWNLKTEILSQQLLFHLRDADTLPISGADGELTLYLAQQKELLHLTAVESAPGQYRFSLPDDIAGSLQARVEFSFQGARINRQILVTF